jgi:hypothetical protein
MFARPPDWKMAAATDNLSLWSTRLSCKEEWIQTQEGIALAGEILTAS